MLVVWSNDGTGQATVPWNLAGAGSMAGGGAAASGAHTLMLTVSNSVIAWGANGYGQTNVPSSISTNAVAVAAGGDQSIVLLSNGTVTNWGRSFASVPSGLGNVTAISAGYQHLLALRADGTVVNWGRSNCLANTELSGLNSVKAISAGWNHNVALRSNGTVAVWGLGSDALGWQLTNAPAGLTDIAAIAAGALHSVVLRSNGSVVAWGYNQGGETNVPTDLSNVTAIAAGRGYTLALKPDGTVTGWGAGLPAIPPGLAGVTQIAAGPGHAMAVRGGVLTPLILRQPRGQSAAANGSVSFRVSVASRSQPTYQWQFNGGNIPGATHATLTLTGVSSNTQGNYRVRLSNRAGTTWSEAAPFVLALPPRIVSPTNATLVWVPPSSNCVLTVEATAQGSEYTGLRYDWYRDGERIPELDIPSLDLGRFWPLVEGRYWAVVTNAAGSATSAVWTVRSLAFGTPAVWGNTTSGLPPLGLTNSIALSAGQTHAVALTEVGRVTAWGGNAYGQTNVPNGLSNIVAVAAGAEHTLVLKADGTVTAWGRNNSGQTNVPTNLSNVVAIAAGGAHNLALLSNGTVQPWGASVGTTPVNLTNVTAVAAGLDFNLVLRANGSVTAWGGNSYGQTNVPANLSNVVAIAAGDSHALALKRDGHVVAWGWNAYSQTNVPATLTNAMGIAAGSRFSLALRNDGAVVAWGDNAQGQTDVITNLPAVKLIAAGGAQALASAFSPSTQYPVDVSKDLLLIYNSTSTNSIWVKNYYLAHRPMVNGANVLGLACVTNETALPNELTNQILSPLRSWLDSNPTKRPQYVVLFLDVPSRVNTNNTFGVYDMGTNALRPSVSYSVHTNTPGWRPFVSHINMGNTNDCRAYIEKLSLMASNHTPTPLVISAHAGGYANTNYYLDDTRFGDTSLARLPGWAAKSGLLAAGVSSASIVDSNVADNGTLEGHILAGVNVAGYFCWGGHSTLYGTYATNGNVSFTGQSRWFVMETIESFNGQRQEPYYGNFLKWFSHHAFGGADFVNTPVGAVTHVDEPGLASVNEPEVFFGMWARGKNFGICAWVSRRTEYFQAVGDPLVAR